jgi:hypothetical protein
MPIILYIYIMEFVIYNSIDDANHIREMVSNKFLSINLGCYQIIFYKNPNYYFACYCYKGNYVQ